MPEVRIGEIVSAEEVEFGGERHLLINAKVDGDVVRFLQELRDHGLTIFLNIESELCAVKGQPAVAYPEVLSCEMKKGHKGAYHKSGPYRWIGSFVEEKKDD